MKLIIIGLFIVLVSSCASTVSKKELIENNPACQSLPASKAPRWVINLIQNPSSHLYGIGVSNGMSMDFNQLRKASKQSAEAELASSVQVNIKFSLSNKIEQEDVQSKNSLSKTIDQVIESSTDIMLRGLSVDKIWLNRKTCQLWTLVKISKKDVKKSETQLQKLVYKQLNAIGSDISLIKSTIESDPGVILRNYNLQLTQKGFLESTKRNMDQIDRRKIFNLYNRYDFNHEDPIIGSYFFMEPDINGLLMERSFTENIGNTLNLSIFHVIAALPSPEKYNFTQLVSWAKVNGFNLNAFAGTYRVMAHFNAKRSYQKKYESSITKIYEKYRGEMNEVMALYRNQDIEDNAYRKRISEIESKIEALDYSLPDNTLDTEVPKEEFSDQFSPIHFAAAFGTPEAIKVLVKNDVSIKTKTAKGKTVYDIAKFFGNDSVLRYLDNI